MAAAMGPAEDDSCHTFNVATLRAVNKPVITLNKPVVCVGRARECDVCIAETFLSRRHANFTFVNNVWYVESLGANGVAVNFKNIPAHRQAPLSDKDNIEFGQGSGLKYIFRTGASTHHGPSAAKRPRTANEALAVVGEECPSNSQQLLSALRRQEELCRVTFAENQALKAEREQLINENNTLKKEKEELQSKLQEEARRSRERPAMEGVGDPLPAVSLQQLEATLEQEASCSICCEWFVSAVTLSCSHTFCSFCLQQWSTTSFVAGFRCPICRTVTTYQVKTPVVDSLVDSLVQCLGADAQQERRNLVAQRNLAPRTGSTLSDTSDRTAVQQIVDLARALGVVPRIQSETIRGQSRRSPPTGRAGSSAANPRSGVTPRPVRTGRRQARTPVITIDGSQAAGNTRNDVSDSDDDIIIVFGGTENESEDVTSTDSSLSSTSSSSSSEDDDSDTNSDDSYHEGLPGHFYGGYGRCFNCGRQGHWAPGCPF